MFASCDFFLGLFLRKQEIGAALADRLQVSFVPSILVGFCHPQTLCPPPISAGNSVSNSGPRILRRSCERKLEALACRGVI